MLRYNYRLGVKTGRRQYLSLMQNQPTAPMNVIIPYRDTSDAALKPLLCVVEAEKKINAYHREWRGLKLNSSNYPNRGGEEHSNPRCVTLRVVSVGGVGTKYKMETRKTEKFCEVSTFGTLKAEYRIQLEPAQDCQPRLGGLRRGQSQRLIFRNQRN